MLSVVLPHWIRLYLERLRRNPQIGKRMNLYFVYPVDDDGHAEFVQAGRGGTRSTLCGKPKGVRTCHDLEHHKGVILDGVGDCTDKIVVMSEHYWCHTALCGTCFLSGFAVREALNGGARLKMASERGYGSPEHVVLSPPKALWNLPPPVLWKMGEAVAKDRGFLGGMGAFHGRRIDRERGVLTWSPHIHCMGFIAGGFDICRECVHTKEDCRTCNGFKGREVRGFKRDGWLVKVESKRKSVESTICYFMSHISVKVGLKKSHSVHWFGCCSTRVLKGSKPKPVVVCPACKVAGVKSEMEKEAYWGSERLSMDISDPDYRSVFAIPEFGTDGSPNFPSSIDGGGNG